MNLRAREKGVYLLSQVMQLLASVVDELVNNDNLLSVNGRNLQLPHQRYDVPNLLVYRFLRTL